MNKIKLVIIDNDKKFMDRLEYFVADKLDGKASIETISDSEYFKVYFSSPKDIDVLVINEKLCSKEIFMKFNIKTLLILTEQMNRNTGNYTGIYKYTSFEEIVTQIKNASPIFNEERKNRETTVTALCSANGGSGKTTIALGMAACLARSGRKVMYINAQNLNAFQFFLNEAETIPNSVIASILRRSGDLYSSVMPAIKNNGFDYLLPFGTPLSSIGLDNSIYIDIIKAIKNSKKYDDIIVDNETDFDVNTAEIISESNNIFVVFNDNFYSVNAANNLTACISCKENERFYFICNKYKKTDNQSRALENVNFKITEYVRYIDDIENYGPHQLSINTDFKKISYLVV